MVIQAGCAPGLEVATVETVTGSVRCFLVLFFFFFFCSATSISLLEMIPFKTFLKFNSIQFDVMQILSIKNLRKFHFPIEDQGQISYGKPLFFQWVSIKNYHEGQ